MNIEDFEATVEKNFRLLGTPGGWGGCCPLGVGGGSLPDKPWPRDVSAALQLPFEYCDGVVAGWDHDGYRPSAKSEEWLRGQAFGNRMRVKKLKEIECTTPK